MDEIALIGPANGYSKVASVPAGGRLVWTSGQVPVAADGSVPQGWEEQSRLVFQNLTEALAAGGARWRDVFKLTLYVVDTGHLPVVRAVRDEFVDTERPPTSSLVQVAGLFRPDVLLEVEAVASVS
ncbi:RidA family protein [Actinocorallia populi]|uniref:RidA family protein n=1 Tax=Actinocorallia populi TaxID=2079200 RepID=UPI000D09502E|nr:RidA family protein [Actinocorallia populi]